MNQFIEAVHCHKAGHLERASTLYHSHLNDSPDDISALNLLGLCSLSSGNHALARSSFDRAISLDNTKDEITDLYPSEMTDGNSNANYTDDDWEQINVNATLSAQNPFVTKGFSSPP